MWRWLERRSQLRRARNYLRLYPRDEVAVRRIFAALDTSRPESARDAAEIVNGKELSEADVVGAAPFRARPLSLKDREQQRPSMKMWIAVTLLCGVAGKTLSHKPNQQSLSLSSFHPCLGMNPRPGAPAAAGSSIGPPWLSVISQ